MPAEKSCLIRGLPKSTRSLCPECGAALDARLFEEDGKVMMEKRCKKHGHFTDIYWADAEMYLRAETFATDGKCVENPYISNAKVCPDECGICNLHLGHTVLANIDATNRCNLRCPICFANANATGYVYEPDYGEIVRMLEVARENRPVPTPAVQFSGGEPTLHPRFLDMVRKAGDMGFAQVQVATNGLSIAARDDYAQELSDAGANTLYLQFDGLRDEDYIKMRGRPLLEVKKKVIENCRRVTPEPLGIVLVPTIVNTLNDDQVGDILKFAIKNIDVVRGINYQPVCFTGRISHERRMKERFTLPDLADRLEKQTGFVKKSDFYPVPCVSVISDFVSAVERTPKVTFSAHPHCGIATYLFIEDEKVIPITRFVDVDGFFREVEKITESVKRSRIPKVEAALRSLKLLKYFDSRKAPKNVRRLIKDVFLFRTRDALAKFHWNTLFIGGMHFQDCYNYDIERVKRCAIHYITPDEKRRIVPFCAYNSGPTFRNEVERKYGVPLAVYREAASTDAYSTAEEAA